MKIDFAKELNNHDGLALTYQGKPATLGLMVRAALDADFADERIAGAEKFKRWRLAERTLKPDAEFTVAEVKTMMDVLAKAFPPAIVGPAFQILDPTEGGE